MTDKEIKEIVMETLERQVEKEELTVEQQPEDAEITGEIQKCKTKFQQVIMGVKRTDFISALEKMFGQTFDKDFEVAKVEVGDSSEEYVFVVLVDKVASRHAERKATEAQRIAMPQQRNIIR